MNMVKFNRIVCAMGLRWLYTEDGDDVKVYHAGYPMTRIVCVLPHSVCLAEDLSEVEETIRLHLCFGTQLLQ